MDTRIVKINVIAGYCWVGKTFKSFYDKIQKRSEAFIFETSSVKVVKKMEATEFRAAIKHFFKEDTVRPGRPNEVTSPDIVEKVIPEIKQWTVTGEKARK